MRIHFGISAGFTIKRWADPEDWVNIVKNKLGLDLVQFSFDQFDPRGNTECVETYCHRLKNACRKYDVKIHSTFTGLSIYSHNLLYHPLLEGRLDGIDWFNKAFKMTQLLSVSATGGPFGGMDVISFRDPSKRKHLEGWALEALVNLLQMAGQYGIKEFYWEPTPVRREGPVTIDETRELLEKVNGLAGQGAAQFALCLDTGHATNPSTSPTNRDPYLWIEQMGKYAPVLHLQQSDGRLDRHWPFTTENNAAGIIEADKVLDALDSSGTDEITLFVEVGHPFEEDDDKVLVEITQSVNYWRQALTRRGIL